MDNIYTYIVKLPHGINELVTPCADGYTIYLNENMTKEKRIKAYMHALKHIQNNDFDHNNVQQIEFQAHKRV